MLPLVAQPSRRSNIGPSSSVDDRLQGRLRLMPTRLAPHRWSARYVVRGGCAARAAGSYLGRPRCRSDPPRLDRAAGAALKGFTMTPQFLRSEAARFREMAESLTDREASRQRLLAMAIDYDKRAEQAEQFQPHEQMQAAPEAASDGATEPESDRAGRSTSTKLRLSRTKGGKLALGERT